MLPTLLTVAIVIGTAATLLHAGSSIGRALLVAGLASGLIWLLAAALATIYQRGKPLLLLVLIVAVAAAVLAYRRLGALYAAAVGLAIIVATAIALV